MKRLIYRLSLVLLVCFVGGYCVHAQELPNGGLNRPTDIGMDSQGRPVKKNKDTTLRHRDASDDSITVVYRYFDSTRLHSLDSSLNDFHRRFPLPYTYYHLGNFGTAAKSYLFNPYTKPGFDPGFHAFDIYKFSVKDTRFFETTRPFSELSYILGSKAEQVISLLHTQNRNSNLNFAFHYRFINSPGTYQNQNTNHNNIRFNVGFSSPNKRYHLFVILINNKLKSSENGGLRDPSRLDSLTLSDPIELLPRLGGTNAPRRDPFRASISTGTTHTENILMLRNEYDFGQKDSLVTDSVVQRLFYPRFRIQHTFIYSVNSFNFSDVVANDSLYKKYFNYQISKGQTFISMNEKWRNIANEFSAISFPVKNNPNQFIKVSLGYELIKGTLDTNTINQGIINYNNIYMGAQYRNRTRNKKWELEAEGKLYTAGAYGGDYMASILLSRSLGERLGFITVGAENVNRSPSFVFDERSAFPVVQNTAFNKENITRLQANLNITRLNLQLFANYYLLSNYSYFDSFYHAAQESQVFNLLHLGAEKKIRLRRNLNWYIEAHVQQKTGASPVNVPLIFTRNRIVWEGRAFKNLNWATGVEVKYHSPYKPDDYSPITGQFFYQDNLNITNRPDLNFFLNFRITRFSAYIRVENINAVDNKPNTRAPFYLDRTLWLRFGIFWNFIN